MKNSELFLYVQDQLRGLGDFSVFNKRQLLAAIAMKDLSDEQKRGIEAAIAIIIDCKCIRGPNFPTVSSEDFSEDTKDRYFAAMEKATGQSAA